MPIDHGYRGAAVIHKQLLAGTVNLAHAALQCPGEIAVALAEAAVAVAWIRFPVLLPQELKCQPFLLEFLVDDGPIRIDAARLRDGRGREQAPFDQCFVSILQPRPGKACGLCAFEVFPDRPVGNVETAGNAALR